MSHDEAIQINARLDRIEERLTAIEEAERQSAIKTDERLTAIETAERMTQADCNLRHAEDLLLKAQVAEHKKVLFGNGKPGMVENFNRLDERMGTTIRLLKWQVGLLVAIGLGVAQYFFV